MRVADFWVGKYEDLIIDLADASWKDNDTAIGQLAATGTLRADSKGMTENGETWQNTQDQDVNKYGVVGCVGSLWEWIAGKGRATSHLFGFLSLECVGLAISRG